MTDQPNGRRYRWPWFVLAAVLLALALAALWLSKEIQRARRIRELNAPASQAEQRATCLMVLAPVATWRA
jgi:hypothetical protein